MSGIGLTGSHGCGKTTLAQACSERYKVHFLKSRASQVIIDAGYNPGLDYDFETRLMLQNMILDSAVEDYESQNGSSFISDRTPLDFLAYLMSDVRRNNVDELSDAFMAYQKRCFDVINAYFCVVIVIQPGVQLIAREGKGTPNAAYIEHHNTLITGLSLNSSLKVQHTLIPRHVVDLGQRILGVNESVKIAFNSFEQFAAAKGATNFSRSVH
jgi:predicted ATPase